MTVNDDDVNHRLITFSWRLREETVGNARGRFVESKTDWTAFRAKLETEKEVPHDFGSLDADALSRNLTDTLT